MSELTQKDAIEGATEQFVMNLFAGKSIQSCITMTLMYARAFGARNNAMLVSVYTSDDDRDPEVVMRNGLTQMFFGKLTAGDVVRDAFITAAVQTAYEHFAKNQARANEKAQG